MELQNRVGAELFLRDLNKFLKDKEKKLDREFKNDRFFNEILSGFDNEDSKIKMSVIR